MDDEKLQRLHDTLSKLAPKGKFGGLGLSALNKGSQSKDPSLPENSLYKHFVRAGFSHKRQFVEEKDENHDSKKIKKSKSINVDNEEEHPKYENIDAETITTVVKKNRKKVAVKARDEKLVDNRQLQICNENSQLLESNSAEKLSREIKELKTKKKRKIKNRSAEDIDESAVHVRQEPEAQPESAGDETEITTFEDHGIDEMKKKKKRKIRVDEATAETVKIENTETDVFTEVEIYNEYLLDNCDIKKKKRKKKRKIELENEDD